MCNIENCDKPIHSKGLCQNHYRQAQRRERGLKKPGPKPDPTAPRSRHNPDNPKRLKPKKEKVVRTECKNGHSYDEFGVIRKDGKRACKECLRINTAVYRDKAEPKSETTSTPQSPDELRDRVVREDLDKKAQREAKRQEQEVKAKERAEYLKYRESYCKRGHEYTEGSYTIYHSAKVCKRCQRITDLHRKYGVTEEWINETLDKQGNACALCSTVFEETPRVDHDHKTGKTRGLLCHNCNTGLGQLKDSIETLKKAIAYLESFSETEEA